MWRPVFALAFGSVLALGAGAQAPSSAHVEGLIRQMSSVDYRERTQAMQALARLGPRALTALKAASSNPDQETRRRAAQLVARIEELLLSQRVLAPTNVNFAVEDLSVPDAVAQLARLSGYPANGYAVQLKGDAVALAKRRITLHTGETSFLEALHQICTKAALSADDESQRYGQPEGSQISLSSGTPPQLVSFSGAVCVRLFRLPLNQIGVKGKGEYQFDLSVVAEPRFDHFSLVGAALVESAIDDQGQTLGMAITPASSGIEAGIDDTVRDMLRNRPPRQRRQTPLCLMAGARPAKVLKELTGTVTARIQMKNQVLASFDVKRAIGEPIGTKDGGILTVVHFEKQPGNRYGLLVKFEHPSLSSDEPTEPPELQDSRGRPYHLEPVLGRPIGIRGDGTRLVYVGSVGQEEPTQLVLRGSCDVAVSVPFRFVDVPLE